MGPICHVRCPTRLYFLLSVCSKFLFLEFPPLRLTSCLVFAFSLLCMWCAHHCSNRRAPFPSGWYPLHALGSLCRRGLLRDQIRKTSLYTLHASFCFLFPLLYLEVHFGSFLNTTYWMSVCSHSHKITVTVDFATYSFSQEKDREVVPITLACEYFVAFLLLWREVERLPSAWCTFFRKVP